jgi:hypothetical protein
LLLKYRVIRKKPGYLGMVEIARNVKESRRFFGGLQWCQ